MQVKSLKSPIEKLSNKILISNTKNYLERLDKSRVIIDKKNPFIF